jgi:hypothetical protein
VWGGPGDKEGRVSEQGTEARKKTGPKATLLPTKQAQSPSIYCSTSYKIHSTTIY